MKVKYLFIFANFVLFFLFNTKVFALTHDISSKLPISHIILIQNKSSLSEDYPVITKIETKVLGNNFAGEDIYKRLNRLELSVFGKISQKSLSERVDALNDKVIGSEPQNSNSDEDDDYSSNSAPSDDDDASLNNLLNQMEQQLMSRTYSNDSTESRVSRLENFIFNQSSADYPMQERIERLSTVIKAQPSDEIYKNMAQLKNDQMLGQGISLVALILMIVAGLIL